MATSVLDIIKRTFNRGKKTFRFTLSEASEGVLQLVYAPDGWAEAETTYMRHMVYGSVMRNMSTKELTFYKDGKQFIQNVYENSGIDADITFTVEKLNKTTYEYESYPSANKIDLSTYDTNEIGVSVQLVDTQFKEKVINRDSTEIDIKKLVSIEGLDVAEFPINEFIIPDTSVDSSDTVTLGNVPQAAGEFVVSVDSVTSADFSEMQTPTSTTINTKDASFFKESTKPRIVTIVGDINWFAKTAYSLIYNIVHIDSSNNVIFSWEVFNETFTGGDDEGDTFSINLPITLSTGDSLIFQCTYVGSTVRTLSSTFDVTEEYTGTQETDVYGLPYYETFLRLCQICTDKNNPFYSDFFGRTDTPLTTYGSDGEIGFVTRGIYFRETNPQTNDTIPLKLKDFFQSMSGIFRLGLGIETIGGVDKVRVEYLDYFFDANVVLDISDRLREQDIRKRVIPDMFYKSNEVGYNKYEYENNAGLLEFNTKSTWTTVIKSVFKDFKKIVKYRGDGQGMRLILNTPYKVDDNGDPDYDSTEDVKGDDDIFLIDALRDGSDFVARTNEGFTSILGSVYADASFNVRYSPARNLLKWGANIKAGLLHSLNSLIRWQSSGKNTTLQSQLTTESSPVIENADIIAGDLNDTRWINEEYFAEAPITTIELNVFDANPNRLIKLSATKYGWVKPGGKMKTTNKNGMAEFELIRCNLSIVTPIEA